MNPANLRIEASVHHQSRKWYGATIDIHQLRATWEKLVPEFIAGRRIGPTPYGDWRRAVYSFLGRADPNAIVWDYTFKQCTINNILVFIVKEPNGHQKKN